jgi:signal peptidase I
MRLALLIVLFLATVTAGCSGLAYRNVTRGMAPTLNVDDAFTVNPWAYSTHSIERFDIVVFDIPAGNRRTQNKEERWIKRIIGLPGETIEMRSGKVFINGQLLNEPFEKIEDEPNTNWKRDYPPTHIPQDEYFVLGDNRPNSEDSRYYDPPSISKDKIRGKLANIYRGYYKKN